MSIRIDPNTGSVIMTGIDNNLSVGIKSSDDAAFDAFGRWRISEGVTLFDSTLQYTSGSLFWDESSSSGSVTHIPNQSAVRLTVGSANGAKMVRQTWQYHRYQPGKSQQIFMTGVVADGQTNVSQQYGYYDDDNGIFLKCVNGSPSMVLRTKSSGAVVDVEADQSTWNLDKMDGTGISGSTIDMDKSQIFCIDLEWLSVGRVRTGFVIDGQIRYTHKFSNANVSSCPYMTTANLPLRYEIKNTAGQTSSTSMLQICNSVISEGGFESDRGIPRSVGNGVTEIAVTNRRPILSIRSASTFNGIVNRGLIVPDNIDSHARTNDAYIEIVYNGTLTDAAFASVGADSIVEYDVAASAITGGIVLGSFSVNTGTGISAGGKAFGLLSKLPMALNIDGASPRNLSVVATSYNATTNVSAQLSWTELY